jgi:RNA-directed DNA polymerase
MMHDREKSDLAIVATKPTNKAGRPVAEPGERRAEAKGNADQQSTRRAQDRESVSQALDRIRQAARQRKKEQFTSLFHHINIELLRTAFFALKRNAAPGVDGLTWQDYEADLERKLDDLHARVHRGAYRASPSRRQYIPKPDGRQRPLAVAALEDKIVQRATIVLLNAIYEEDFLGFSYGFRAKRGQHDALDALIVGITSKKVNYVLDADISRNRASFILGQAFVLPLNTRGGSRMREIRPYGSVRGALSNGRPYRNPKIQWVVEVAVTAGAVARSPRLTITVPWTCGAGRARGC